MNMCHDCCHTEHGRNHKNCRFGSCVLSFGKCFIQEIMEQNLLLVRVQTIIVWFRPYMVHVPKQLMPLQFQEYISADTQM